MDQLATFVSNNWILVGALVVILFLLVNSFMGAVRGLASTSPAEAVKMINQDDAVVLDVREESEYQEGHIINAEHVPLSQLQDKTTALQKKYKGRPIIATCRSGHRSGQACKTLKNAGFDNVYNLNGGILGWKSANLPLVNKKQDK